jgi:hypothetical protein
MQGSIRVSKVVTLSMALMLGAAAPEPARDWAATARDDVTAFHRLVRDNHPGPVNALDPGFTRRSDAALALALRRAASVRDYPGYLATMRGYQAHFDDGHVAFSIVKDQPVAVRWPGFLTAYDGDGRQRVRARADDAAVPIGAELVACDGRPADRLAQEIVGAFRGRWQLASMRGREGYRVFVDNGNPFVRRPERCTFRINGRVQAVSLAWRDFADAEWTAHAVPLSAPPRPPIAARTLADGTRWFTMSDFDGDLSGPAAKALLPMIAAMRTDRESLVAAPRIVLDLRGNGGGSSDWSRQVAAILWGEPAIARLDLDSDGVDWRASAANVATLAAYREEFDSAADASPAIKRYFAAAADGIAGARAAGRALWREPADLYTPDPPPAGAAPVTPPTRPIYVLTDWGCASACLDAVDLWKALGAVQVGQETSADTLYMDVRQDPLPSGLARAVVPMKVYRGRPRGSNVPQMPAHRYTGDMRDTVAVERWIAGLR